MALTEFETSLVEVLMDDFIKIHRPPEHIRDNLDLSYRIEDQSVFLVEIVPYFRNPEERIEREFAKTTYVRKDRTWKVYWMRASGNFEKYPPMPQVNSLEEFLELVDKDEHGCFWG